MTTTKRLIERITIDTDTRTVSGFCRKADLTLHFARLRVLALRGELV